MNTYITLILHACDVCTFFLQKYAPYFDQSLCIKMRRFTNFDLVGNLSIEIL